MTKIWVSAMLVAACGVAMAKLPPPDDATKAKAAEAAAKGAWQGKVDGYLLCKAQDKIAAKYRSTSAGNGAKTGAAALPVVAKPTPAAAGTAAAPAASAPGTPATAAAPPPCADPGPFAYNPPEQKPLETSGAHSPTGTAANPPSVRAESAKMVPAKK
jgi:hypothetical protein